MAYSNGPKIVTDGLVLCLDAANRKSYPGSGTSWTDLSGNGNNGSLVNGVGYNSNNAGSLVFDGSDDYISIGSQNLIGTGNSPITLEFWMYNTKNWTSGQYTMPIRIKQDTELFVSLYRPSDTLNSYIVFRNHTQWGTPVTQSDYVNKWICLSYVYTGGNKSLAASYISYLNASQQPTGTNNFGTAGGVASNCNIIGSDGNSGCNVISNGKLQGNLSYYKLYNRALTAQEIQQNYNALKGRYGLT